ncbi:MULTISPECIES: APC family permease [unclassified Halomonas]|uniref:APC family permease n=1 Tax=unclassified Halomonas TaxID=2609666 RepID=UPI0006D9ABA0|nr:MULTISPECIES: APC family permease [unclassified Halomonas]KPQ21860.1 MAG: putative gamma-aminobutyric acid permease [Halomonas sp. HL-93]SBR45703.1 amino acid/polyamine/organocation transporter, APC superfamily [Halomonas sp. HL-93]SNY98408.1 amino acid/polyamine/organocation transporter, APC superfamily [Halomonas sp. hl-4]
MTTSSSEQAKLVRVLARGDVLALAFGAMIGWGWIVLTGTAIQSAGSVGAILAFIIGGLAIVLVGLTYAELASAMPKVGGEHVYSYRALGHWPSFFCTWAIILGYLSVVAFEAVALPTVVEHLAPNYAVGHMWTIAGWEVKATWVAVGVGGSLAMMIINYFGVSTAALLQKVVTGVILLVGVMFVTGSLFEGSTANMMPLFSQSEGSVISGIIAVIVMVPFLFVGFDVIPQAAEEINLPYKAIGKVLMVSVILAVVWYSLIILATSLALDNEAIGASSLSVPDAMESLFNASWAGNLMVIAGIAGIITSWNAFYIGGSRAIYALANAGMLPAVFSKLHPRYKTPTNAIFLMGFLSCLAPLFGRPALVWIVNAGGLGIVLAYLFVAVSFMVLRVREPDMPRPFKVSYGKLCGTLAVVLSFGMACLYLPGSPAALGTAEWIILAVWTLLGIGLYFHALHTYGRDYSDRHMKAEM